MEGDSEGGGEQVEGVRETGEPGRGSGILKVIESGRNWGKLRNIGQNYAIEKKRTEAGANKNRTGTGI